MQHHALGDGRHVLRLDPGEEVVATLRRFAERNGLTAGVITGLGSVDAITLGFLDVAAEEYLKRRFEERMEVASLTGSLSVEDDHVHVHLHAVVAPREFLAYAGHVHEATVGAALEVYVSALPIRLERATVPGQAFPQLVLPGETPPTAPKKAAKKKDGSGAR